jgi:acetyl esterase/lipase
MTTARWAGAAYLVASGIAAANTLNAYRPLAWTGRGSVAAFFAGFATSEVPAASLVVSGVETAAALGLGAGRTRSGRAGLALSAVSAAALVGLEVRSRPAPRILNAALTEALGPDYQQKVVQPPWPEPDAPLRPPPGVLRTLQVNKRYAHHSDIEYGPAGRRNHLDVWRRDDLPAGSKAPVLVQVHGGAWIYGNKLGQAHPLMAHLVERGWVCVSVNYRLSPRSTWPDQILDVKRAVAWVKQHIAEYGGDPDFVSITGGSAGGHLTALHALTAQDRRWQPGFEDVDTTVAAAVPFYGVYDWTNRDGTGSVDLIPMLEEHVVKASITDQHAMFDEASPMRHIRPDAPPFFVLHGTHDTLVPVAQARSFVRQLRVASDEPVAYAEFPGAQHAFDIFSSTRANACAVAVERFLGVIYGEHLRRRRSAHAPGVDARGSAADARFIAAQPG